MAGHSKFKNIMHRKGAQDKKRAKIFSRLGKEISVSVKVGGQEISGTTMRKLLGSEKYDIEITKKQSKLCITWQLNLM